MRRLNTCKRADCIKGHAEDRVTMPISTAAKEQSRQRASSQAAEPTTSALLQNSRGLSLLPCDLNKCTRREIQQYFENTYMLDEYLFSGIVDEKYMYKCPDRLRLPLIFYLAHPATLYVNKLLLAGLISKRVNRPFETMFETGVDEMCWDDTENYRMGGAYQWPEVREVMEYRRTVKELVTDLINSAPLELPVTTDHPWWSLFMGMEHERIHLETSSVLIRQLPVEFVKKPDNWNYAPLSMDVPAGENVFVKVPPGQVTIGKPQDFPSYGWDNEYGQANMDVPEFEATQYLVTNGEFLDFVESGGYQNKELWTKEGWQWVQYRQARHPTFWVCSEGCKSGCGADLATYTHCNLPKEEEENGANGSQASSSNSSSKFQYRAMFDVLPMPWDWPVDVNYHEAKAFCSWKGPSYRLPTEAEHHRLRGDLPPSSDPSCDPAFSTDFQANINFKYGSSSPVNMFPPNSMGFYDVYGNVWEWTEDQFNGLPGFKTHYLYDDFSSPCFDGRHTMMTGGSWISTGDEASRFARFSFRRHFFQHMGFRMVRSTSSLPPPVRLCKAEVFVLGCGVTENPITVPGADEKQACVDTTNIQFAYESSQNLDEILHQQYGQEEQYGLPLTKMVEDAVGKYSVSTSSAINFGCGAGLTAFLLSKTFETVVGVDFCGRFIDASMKIQRGKVLQYGSQQVAKLPSEADPSRVQFKQLTWTPNELEDFDVIVFEFLDKVNEPKGWLYKLWEILKPKGLAVFASSSDWDKEKIESYIGKWFTLMEETAIAGRNVSLWQLK